MQVEITYGKLTEQSQLIGKTIEAVGWSSVEGAYGNEPMTVLFFTDKTFAGFIHPQEDN
jgi:hypothetical protein